MLSGREPEQKQNLWEGLPRSTHIQKHEYVSNPYTRYYLPHPGYEIRKCASCGREFPVSLKCDIDPKYCGRDKCNPNYIDPMLAYPADSPKSKDS